MKNKIVVGLGLILGVTAGISFADDMGTFLSGPTEQISASSPARIDTSSLTSNKYYDITCNVNNIYNEKDVLMFDRIHSHHTAHNMGPVLVNGVRVEPVHNHIEVNLNPGINIVVFQQYVVEENTLGSHIKVQAKNHSKASNPFGINGFYLLGCTYAPAPVIASNGNSVQDITTVTAS